MDIVGWRGWKKQIISRLTGNKSCCSRYNKTRESGIIDDCCSRSYTTITDWQGRVFSRGIYSIRQYKNIYMTAPDWMLRDLQQRQIRQGASVDWNGSRGGWYGPAGIQSSVAFSSQVMCIYNTLRSSSSAPTCARFMARN